MRSGKYESSRTSCKFFQHLLRIGFENAKSLFKCDACVRLDQPDQVPLLADLWHAYPDASASSFAQESFQRLAVVKIVWDMDLKRNIIGRIILHQNFAEKLARVK